MLPFLKNKKYIGGAISEVKRKPDGSMEPAPSETEEVQALKACASDLIKAVHAKDVDGVAMAIEAAFDILEAMPHAEGPHTNDPEESSEG